MFSINIDEEAYENFRIGYGFDVTYETGWSIIANFERFHAISSGYINEVYLSVGYVPTEDIKYALALENEKASLNYNKHINGFDIQLGSNYKLLSQIPEYGVADMAEIAPILETMGYDPFGNPPKYGDADQEVIENTN